MQASVSAAKKEAVQLRIQVCAFGQFGLCRPQSLDYDQLITAVAKYR